MKLAIGVVVLACGVAVADAPPTAEQRREEGELLAKQGRYTEAIAAFKASNALRPRATTLCLIGLAYTRREAWSQAEVMIDRCKRGATADDPTPDWLPELEQLIVERLAAVDVAPVTIVVMPPAVQVQLSVSSFAPDELFEPRTIHLPVGHHLVVANAPGYATAQKQIEITDRTPRHVTIEMLTEAEQRARMPKPRSAAMRRLPAVMMATGATLVATGIVYHLIAFRPAADGLAHATDPAMPDPAEYDRWSHRYDVRRAWVIGLYATGIVTAGIGAVIGLARDDRREQTTLALVPTDGGALLAVSGQR